MNHSVTRPLPTCATYEHLRSLVNQAGEAPNFSSPLTSGQFVQFPALLQAWKEAESWSSLLVLSAGRYFVDQLVFVMRPLPKAWSLH